MKHRQRGLTLVELLVSVAIGVLLLFGVSQLFTQNKQSYIQNEQVARIQESARFAIEEMSRDLSMAGFYAEAVDRLAVGVNLNPAGLPSCNSAIAGWFNDWFYNFDNGLLDGTLRVAQDVSGAAQADGAFSCIAENTVADTDVIGIRRTSGTAQFWDAGPACDGLQLPLSAPCASPPVAGIYFRKGGSGGALFSAAGAQLAPPPPSFPSVAPYEDWEYTPRVYYVREVDGIPNLCRRKLVNGAGGPVPTPVLTEECFVQGVEDMQVEVGIDTDGDGSANAYVASEAADDLNSAVSVRVYLRLRGLQIDPGHDDSVRRYTYAGQDFVPAAGDRFHRRVYTTTVALRNMNNIRRLGF